MRLTFLVAATAMLSASLAARADLTGNSVNVTYAYPNPTTTYDNLGDYTVPGAGAIAGIASFTLASGQITVTSSISQDFNPASFNGFEFTDVSTNPDITSVTVDGASTLTGEAITYTSDEVFVNLEGVSANAGQDVVLDLTFGSAASVTPEPSSIALLGTGLLGIAGVMKRRFA